MINTFLLPELKKQRRLRNTILQQDGTTCHTTKVSMELLKRSFGSRLISQNSAFAWPLHLPDLSPYDYFLWGYLKSWVYMSKPHTLTQLKEIIRRKITTIQPAMLRNIYENFEKRLENRVNSNGHHLDSIIFTS